MLDIVLGALLVIPDLRASGDCISSLVARTQGHTDFSVLVRAINRIDPNAWAAVGPVRVSISSAAMMGAFARAVALIGFVGIGGLVLALVLSSPEAAAQPTATPTQTSAPTRTPVPTFTHTPTNTPIPSATPTPSKTPRPTNPPATVGPSQPPTDTPAPTPVTSIIYPAVEPLRPPSNQRSYPGEMVEFRWILRGAAIAADERYLMRLYLGSQVVDTYVTSDPWRYYPVPSGANGTFGWTVQVVKVDVAGNLISTLSPESGQRMLVLQP